MRSPLFLLCCLVVCPLAVADEPAVHETWTIELVHDDAPSRATRAQLFRFFGDYDLSRWIMTREIVIDSTPRTIPHSHPRLTLSTRHLRDDDLLLGTFIHEQMHWFTVSRPEAMQAAVAELREAFPDLPVGYPDGARTEESSYQHLIVISLEYWGLYEVLGEMRARAVLEFWTHDHYRTLYKLALDRGREIRRIQSKHGLWPKAQNAKDD